MTSGKSMQTNEQQYLQTSSPSTMMLSWLIHANSGVFWGFWPAEVVFGVRSEFISRFVHARLQVSACSGYDLCNAG